MSAMSPLGKKILVADDSLTIQKVIRLALSNEGYEIHTVTDGKDAIEQISVVRPDVVLIDVSLPHQTAFEIKKQINEHQDLSHTRFILMSSAFESVNEALAEEVHFDARLTKPFDPAHLREVLAKVFAMGGQATTPTSPTASARPPSAPPALPPQMPSQAPPQMPPRMPMMPPPPKMAPPQMQSTPPRPPVDLEPPSSHNDILDLEGLDEPITLESHKPTEPPKDDFLEEFDQPLTPLPPLNPPAEMAPPPPPIDMMGADSDIKKLTESTIKMSGLDDFNWNIQEPSMRPSPNLLDQGGTTLASMPSSLPLDFPPTQPENDEPTMVLSHPNMKETTRTDMVAPPPPRFEAPTPVAPPLPLEEVERMVQEEVQKTLAKLSQQLIPGLAEKIIREEIHKMLNQLAEGR